MNKRIVIIGAVLMLLAIILGAFGAHSLKELISPEKLTSYETGVRYQVYHGLALLVIGLNAEKFKNGLRAFCLLILLGVILFSGSIYFLSIEEILHMKLSFLGPVTPVGGVLMIAGWIVFIIKLLPVENRQQ